MSGKYQSEMEAFLASKSPVVQRSVEIITPDELPVPFLFHISTDTKIKKFVPLIGKRQGATEDRTVPRICTAPTLLGCMLGYSAVQHDFMNGDRKEGYQGGYKIYGFDFQKALRATKKVVYDAAVSDECWLVAYNAETAEYKAIDFGRMFLGKMEFKGNLAGHPDSEMVVYVEIKHDAGVPFGKNIMLTKGYWKIEGPAVEQLANWKKEKYYEVKEITQAEYLEKKELTAGLLDYREAGFLNW